VTIADSCFRPSVLVICGPSCRHRQCRGPCAYASNFLGTECQEKRGMPRNLPLLHVRHDVMHSACGKRIHSCPTWKRSCSAWSCCASMSWATQRKAQRTALPWPVYDKNMWLGATQLCLLGLRVPTSAAQAPVAGNLSGMISCSASCRLTSSPFSLTASAGREV
jgi:hypothetical protein